MNVNRDDSKNILSKHMIKYNLDEYKLTFYNIVYYDIDKVYDKLMVILKNKERYWASGNYHLPGINFTILDRKEPEYLKVLYQRTMGLDYWYNPIDVYIEVFLNRINRDTEIDIQIIPTEKAIIKDLLEQKTYLLDLVVEIWKGLGFTFTDEMMKELYPIEDINERNKKREMAKKRQIRLYVGFIIFCIIVFMIFYLTRDFFR